MPKLELIEEVISKTDIGEKCSINGRVMNMRKHKERIFMDVGDYTGKIQLVLEKKDYPNLFEEFSAVTSGTYISSEGTLVENNRQTKEIKIDRLEILAKSILPVNPTPWQINGLDPQHGSQVFGYPEFYLSNPQRAAVLRIKTNFINALHEYFQNNNFTLVEPPIITNKTLYGKGNAISASVHGEDVFLSQCATFELEPLAMAFGKVYTISPAFRNEPSGSKRHLSEYTHTKAELLLANLEDLMFLAGDSLHSSLVKTIEKSQRELSLIGKEINPDGIKPGNQEIMTYDEALKITKRKGSITEHGNGLTRNDEIILTEHLGQKYVWVQFPPFTSEGFPYKRHPENPDLSMTCDLIAPHGAGEMVGVAEKITDSEELIKNIIEKGLKEDIKEYWNYILLRHYGLPPHGGIGAATERILYGLLELDHIRLTKPWPRYPDRKIRATRQMELNPWKDNRLEELIKKYEIG